MSAFANHGSEKMIYDVRMGPVAVAHEDRICVAYQSNRAGAKALPHEMVYDDGGEIQEWIMERDGSQWSGWPPFLICGTRLSTSKRNTSPK